MKLEIANSDFKLAWMAAALDRSDRLHRPPHNVKPESETPAAI
jgi:hypothetical protein